MTLQEKLNCLEEIMELDENTLSGNENLEDIEEWDSMSKLYLIAHVKEKMKTRLTTNEIKKFKTVKDICDYLE